MSFKYITRAFGDLVEFVSEKSNARTASLETYISTENMQPNFGGITAATSLPSTGSVTNFKVGDTLFSNIRTYFKKVWQAEYGGQCSTDVLVFRTKDNKVLHPDYLHNICRWEKFTEFSIRTSKGAKMPRGDKEAIAQFEFHLPSLEDQIAVTKILNSIDNRITLLRETNKTLESIAQAIFKSWFVDFDPVRAKMEGRQPEGMDEATAALFPDSFEESELGLIPRGWNVNPIGNVIQTVGGGTPATKNPTYWSPETYHWTSPKDLSGLQAPVLLDTERRISAEGLKKISSGLLPKGTLLMSSRAPIGYLALTQIPLAVNQGYIAILPEGQLTTNFMLFWCKQNMAEIKGRANGSTFMEISKKVFRQMPIITPTSAVLDAFENIVHVLLGRITQNEHQIRTLTELRDTLLPRLISGQLRLPEAESLVQEACP